MRRRAHAASYPYPETNMSHVRALRAVRSGFTVVELMVVMAIIALLVGILLPSLGLIRRNAQETVCQSNLRCMGAALIGYCNACGEHMPLSSHTTSSQTSPQAWVNSLKSYGFDGDVRRCPADPYAQQRPSSYATNSYLEPLVAGIDYDPATHATLPGGRDQARTRLSQVPHPETTLWAVEMAGTGFVDHIHSVGWTSSDQVKAAVAVLRHGNSSNATFVDGHAAGVLWTRLATDFDSGHNPFDPDQ